VDRPAGNAGVLLQPRSSIYPRPEPTERSWIVTAEEVKARGYDLTARNPNRPESERLPAPEEIVAGLLEKEREILGIVGELGQLLGNSREETS